MFVNIHLNVRELLLQRAHTCLALSPVVLSTFGQAEESRSKAWASSSSALNFVTIREPAENSPVVSTTLSND